MARTERKIVIEHDSDPDFSWLEQDHYDPSKPDYDPIYPTRADMKAKRNAYDGNWYRDPANHVVLSMVAYKRCGECGAWEVTDSLGGIDFLEASNDWTTGTFTCVADIPKRAKYLRSLAREMKLR